MSENGDTFVKRIESILNNAKCTLNEKEFEECLTLAEQKIYDFESELNSKRKYKLTPKGIAQMALVQCGLIDELDDPKADGFYTIFESGMLKHGYIKEG